MTTRTHQTAAMKAPSVRHLAMAAGVAALTFSFWAHAEGKEKADLPQYAGALAFAPDGTNRVCCSR
jgi:hypothetical protein